MLKLRVMTALILGPLVLWSVLAFSHRAIAIELAIILLVGAWEWGRLSGLKTQYGRIFYALAIGIVMTLMSFLFHVYPQYLEIVLYVASGWWVFATLWLIQTERLGLLKNASIAPVFIFINLLVGLIILLGAFVAITGMHQAVNYGASYILVLLALIWLADSSAYFSGKAFGKHKLSPSISPGKTIEGVVGAIITVVIGAGICVWVLDLGSGKLFAFVLVSVVTVLFSIAGDLFVSMYKRKSGIKDSSNILPGHGGVLDRIDSLLAASPVFFLGLLLAGI